MKHLFLYVDGNRRWARRQDITVQQGYWAAAHRMMPILDYCLDQQIPYVSFYAASTENIRYRSEENKDYFCQVTADCFNQAIKEFIVRGIRVSFIGNLSILPAFVQNVFKQVVEETKFCTNLSFSFLFSYGGIEEILSGVRTMLSEASRKGKSLNEVVLSLNEDMFRQHMWLGDLPQPDLIIRPAGGYQRLSNGPLFHAAYTELCFLDSLWPELDAIKLHKSIMDFSQQKRNFGV